MIAKEVLLSYPDFTKPFHIYTDTSKYQLGVAVITEDDKPIMFYSRKLTDSQNKYNTWDRELLSIVKVLKEYCYILLGQRIIIHADHENLTYDNCVTERHIG